MSLRRLSLSIVVCGLMAAMGFVSTAHAQVVYYGAMRPVMAAPVVAAPVYAAPVVAAPYVANYTPAGNYAAVTAFSPPVYAQPSSVAVTSNYAPAYTAGYAPVMAAAPVAVTSYYAPTAVTAYSPVTEVVAAPVTAYYAPAAVAVPLYRRGLFGGLRPVRSAYYIPY
jgi:hypothetical protein